MHDPGTILAEARERLVPRLHELVRGLPPNVREVASYHFGWAGQASKSPGGKHIRPALLFAVARAVGGDPDRALSAAVAVELVQQFTLLHDDIVDGDEQRHGRPAAWTIFGRDRAMIAGDALLALGLRSALTVGPACAIALADCVVTLCEGESKDMALGFDVVADPVACLDAAREKTGELVKATCAVAAETSGCDSRVAARLGAYGSDLGTAFQLGNDLLGIWGAPTTTGKRIGGDLVAGKQTFPIAVALRSPTSAGRDLRALLAGEPLSETEVLRAARLARETGAVETTQAKIRELTVSALEALRSAVADPGRRGELEMFVDMAQRHFDPAGV
ncbi:polyprenyl synthetase family protein [Allokutzneria sp. NRRL B-24872]|uniref:polyprenyl synthetase family protein n=1 Tax=Allokutzneria sp. NRRL B-24872 TaxID=1137961 RepID=UPI000A3CF276|nr:polyprenyl synthetase family protein [Allokutzneria sp. NRRL B-24872]